VTRQFCDKCGIDITDQKSGHVSGVDDADAVGNGHVTDDVDLCEVCYGGFRQWLETPPGDAPMIVRPHTTTKARTAAKIRTTRGRTTTGRRR